MTVKGKRLFFLASATKGIATNRSIASFVDGNGTGSKAGACELGPNDMEPISPVGLLRSELTGYATHSLSASGLKLPIPTRWAAITRNFAQLAALTLPGFCP
jgi:hypothetical protein